MFTPGDIQQIYRMIPFDQDQDQPSSSVPSLLASATGEHFVTSKHALQEFEGIVSTTEKKQLPIVNIAQQLDIEADIVLQFAKTSPSLALLSRDYHSIIPKKQRDSLEHQLRELIAHETVSKAAFSRDNDVSLESLELLVASGQRGELMKNGLIPSDEYFISKSYEQLLSDAIQKHLDRSLSEAAPIELRSDMLPGTPPAQYMSRTLDSILQQTGLATQFHVDSKANAIRCVPKESVLRRRDAEITRLQEGSFSSADIHSFYENYHELYPAIEAARGHLASLEYLEIHGPTVISKSWLAKFGDTCADALEVLGYANLTSQIRDNFPPTCHKELIETLAKLILASYEQKSSANTTSEHLALHRTGDFLLTNTRYDTDRELLLHSARTHATEQWQQLKENPGKDIKFQMDKIIAFIPDDQQILAAVANHDEVKRKVEEQYWSEISNLESVNEVEFAAYWLERAFSRVKIYVSGLEAVEDAKLRDQLSDLLSNYLMKELIPESISKASSKGLVCSRKTRKNLQKLDATLKGKTELLNVLSAIEKFAKKQSLPELDEPTLTTSTTVMVDDLVRRMQKQPDGPTLFLTLVVVLLANHFSGVVYATGKFAPKLLKQLKPVLSTEQYEQLERWKEMAKAGSLAKGDKDAMRHFAETPPK